MAYPYTQTTVYTTTNVPYPTMPQQNVVVTSCYPTSQQRPCQWCQYKANKKANKHSGSVSYVAGPSVAPVVVVGAAAHHYHHPQHRNHNLAAAALIATSDRPLMTAGLIGAYRRNRR